MKNRFTEKPFYEKFIKKTNIQNKNRETEKDKKNNANNSRQRSRSKIENTDAITKVKIAKGYIFSKLDNNTIGILNSFGAIARSALSLNQKQEALIPKNIRQLFHELTDKRSARKINYLNNPIKLTAYIYYYMWWNLVRISKLIANMTFDLQDGNVIADFGCGPLTAACAFWIAKPELREKKLHWYCIDISAKALSAGESIFNALCALTEKNSESPHKPWQITKIIGSFGVPLKTGVNFFISANMFNEIFWDSSVKVLGEAEKAVKIVSHYLNKNGAVLMIEPGIPLAGEFISELRKQFLQWNFYIESPCPHNGACPMRGTKNYLPSAKTKNTALSKWCHFSFYTDDVPHNLVVLSEAAKLEKTRASLSFLYCKSGIHQNDTNDKNKKSGFIARITSDIIKLQDGAIGRYACSEKGFLLLAEKKTMCSKLKKYTCGSLVKIEAEKPNSLFKDKKTGAAVVYV